mmetsp:Transcript_84465/g.219901  ORF Transcript_84465/g.219901 Transcript_84465/m.219901 type:complete len:217 (+) Transcript_84465:585-1235(+)
MVAFVVGAAPDSITNQDPLLHREVARNICLEFACILGELRREELELKDEHFQLIIRLHVGILPDREIIGKDGGHQCGVFLGALKEQEPHKPRKDHEDLGVAHLTHGLERLLNTSQRLQPSDDAAQRIEWWGPTEVANGDFQTLLIAHEPVNKIAVVPQARVDMLRMMPQLPEELAHLIKGVDDQAGDDVAGIRFVRRCLTDLVGLVEDVNAQILAA